MKFQLLSISLLFLIMTSQTPVLAVVQVSGETTVQEDVQLSGKEARQARKAKRAALLSAIRNADEEDLTADYIMATIAAIGGLALPWIVIVGLYSAGTFLGLVLFGLPLVLGIMALVRHSKRKREGRKAPKGIPILAWIGLAATGIWVLAALLAA